MLLAFNFVTLQFESKEPAKILARWYFIMLGVPLFLKAIKTIFSNEILSLSDGNKFLILTLCLWLIFLLYVSVPFIHNSLDNLVVWLSKDRTKLSLSILLRVYLFSSVSIVIVLYFSDWFMYGVSDISVLLKLFEGFFEASTVYILLLLLVLANLSAILWGLLLLVEKVIAKSKSSEIKPKIKSKYSGFRILVVFMKTLGSTNFEGAELQKADFTEAQLEGVNFRRAKIEGAVWSNATGLDGSAVGNTYLKYPKVRNWVSSEEKVRQVYRV